MRGDLPTTNNWTANALNQYTQANGVTLPTTPAPAPYDLDGNLRFDGGVNQDAENREYLWDAENRLIAVKRASDNTTLVTYAYDHLSRLISRTAGGTTTHYLYDGWNRIAEFTGTTLQKTYTWGMDLSGTMQGAGGVGGLLAVNSGGTVHYPTFDGNGNVSEYLTLTGGAVVVAAHFEYDPFGNTVVDTDSSGQFPYRFSTKPIDAATGLYYYGYRWFDPLTGRWPSRDPIEEAGGANLYGMLRSDALNRVDTLGLTWKALGNGKNHYKATSDNDTLEGLAYKVSGFREDWSCLWPVGPLDKIKKRYPSVKKCDVYDISNIVETPKNSTELLLLRSADLSASYSQIFPGISLIDSSQIAARIQSVSGEGSTPIQNFVLAGHCGANAMGAFSIASITALNKAPIFERAKEMKGPIRCWFCRKAQARFSGCTTQGMAEQMATDVLRKEAIALGTNQTIGTSMDNGRARIWWGWNGTSFTSQGDYFSAPVWVSYKGKQ